MARVLPHAEAKTLYLQERANRPGREAIRAVSQMLDVPEDRLILAARQEGWDDEFERQQARERAIALAEEEGWQPESQLRDIRDKTSQLREVFTNMLDPLLSPEHVLSLGDVQRVQGMLTAYLKLIETADRRIGELQRRNLELRLRPEAQARYEQWKLDLAGQYDGKGPQYEMLIEGAARIHVFVGEMYDSERMFSVQELQQLMNLELSFIEQLQKRTESTKLEVLDEKINVAVIEVVSYFERRFKDKYPDDWQETVHELALATEAA